MDQQLKTEIEFVSVKERLPDAQRSLIILDLNGRIGDDVKYSDEGKFIVHMFGYDYDSFELKNVTHWIYLSDINPFNKK